VFVSQLVMKADERAVRKFFEKVGKVKQVIMIRDKYTNRHKGFAYVEMKKLDAIPLVLMLNNLVPDFQKFPILIKASEAEKNFLAKEDAAAGIKKGHDGMPISDPGVKDKVYVGNLPPQIGEDDLKTVLAAFGPIDSAKVHRDDKTGLSKGFAFVKFSSADDAGNCVSKMEAEGLELMGRTLRVSYAHDPNSAAAAFTGGGAGGGGGGGAPVQHQQSDNWRLDAMAGAPMDAMGRASLMAKLNGGVGGAGLPGLPPPMGNLGGGGPQPAMGGCGGAAPSSMPGMGRGQSNLPAWMTNPAGGPKAAAAAAAAAGGAPPPPMPGAPDTSAGPIGSPSFCVLIKNMFDPATETEQGWDLDIKEDTEGECAKFGAVLHCFVDPSDARGLAYVVFQSEQGAAAAAAHLHGRWFAGRAIQIEYLLPEAYLARCPDAHAAVAQAAGAGAY
jgi:RNA-binding protein 39